METTLRCARCEYDLRDHEVDGICPECALPVSASVAAAAHPLGDIKALRKATAVLLIAAAMRLTFAIVLMLWHWSEGRGDFVPDLVVMLFNLWPVEDVATTANGPSWRRGPWIASLIVLWVALFVVHLVGIWLVTNPRILPGRRRLRFAARWAPIVTIALLLDAITVRLSAFIFFSGWAGTVWAALFVGIPSALLSLWGMTLLRADGRGRRAAKALGHVTAASCIMVGVATQFRLAIFQLPGAICSLFAFVMTSWMWITLWRATRVKMD